MPEVYTETSDPEIVAFQKHQQTAARLSAAEEAKKLIGLARCSLIRGHGWKLYLVLKQRCNESTTALHNTVGLESCLPFVCERNQDYLWAVSLNLGSTLLVLTLSLLSARYRPTQGT